MNLNTGIHKLIQNKKRFGFRNLYFSTTTKRSLKTETLNELITRIIIFIQDFFVSGMYSEQQNFKKILFVLNKHSSHIT